MKILAFVAAVSVLANPEPEQVSSICSAEDFASVKCDDERDCAFKIQKIVSDFLAAYETPPFTKAPQVDYPDDCTRRSSRTDAVVLGYAISPDGRPTDIEVLASSNRCFEKPARIDLRRARHVKSENGFRCALFPVVYERPPVSDAIGQAY